VVCLKRANRSYGAEAGDRGCGAGDAGLCSAVHVGIACSAHDVLRLLDSWDIPRHKRVRIAA
jgi:hypothetical protein